MSETVRVRECEEMRGQREMQAEGNSLLGEGLAAAPGPRLGKEPPSITRQRPPLAAHFHSPGRTLLGCLVPAHTLASEGSLIWPCHTSVYYCCCSELAPPPCLHPLPLLAQLDVLPCPALGLMNVNAASSRLFQSPCIPRTAGPCDCSASQLHLGRLHSVSPDWTRSRRPSSNGGAL